MRARSAHAPSGRRRAYPAAPPRASAGPAPPTCRASAPCRPTPRRTATDLAPAGARATLRLPAPTAAARFDPCRGHTARRALANSTGPTAAFWVRVTRQAALYVAPGFSKGRFVSVIDARRKSGRSGAMHADAQRHRVQRRAMQRAVANPPRRNAGGLERIPALHAPCFARVVAGQKRKRKSPPGMIWLGAPRWRAPLRGGGGRTHAEGGCS
jgi:hypothetical protein